MSQFERNILTNIAFAKASNIASFNDAINELFKLDMDSASTTFLVGIHAELRAEGDQYYIDKGILYVIEGMHRTDYTFDETNNNTQSDEKGIDEKALELITQTLEKRGPQRPTSSASSASAAAASPN